MDAGIRRDMDPAHMVRKGARRPYDEREAGRAMKGMQPGKGSLAGRGSRRGWKHGRRRGRGGDREWA